MKKGIVAGLIVLCVALGAGTAAVVVTDDRKGPEIELPADGDVTYEEGSDTAPLLEGVTATDEKDGDVTDSLVIENIFPNDDHTMAADELEKLYTVPFFIWTNYDTPEETVDITSLDYLSTMALERAGI